MTSHGLHGGTPDGARFVVGYARTRRVRLWDTFRSGREGAGTDGGAAEDQTFTAPGPAHSEFRPTEIP